MELGMIHRGEHSEITTIVGDTVDSELSGNMIDICPVGALTSKPFRYSARTWELSRRKSVSPHDSTGANLIVQVKSDQVMRVVPLENEDVNECWIADRDRFSYEALNARRAPDRADDQAGRRSGRRSTGPTRARLRDARPDADHGRARRADASARSARRISTVEELHLLAKLVRGLGSENIDHRAAPRRLRRPADGGVALARHADRVAVRRCSACSSSARSCARTIRCFAQRTAPGRAARRAKVHSLHALRDDWADADGIDQHASRRAAGLRGAGRHRRRDRRGQRTSPRRCAAQATDAAAKAIAASLLSGERKAILLGNAAAQHPQAATLLRLAQLDRRADRRQRRLPDRGRQQRRRAARRRLPGEGGAATPARCSAAARR